MATRLYATAAAAPVDPAEATYDAAGTQTWETPTTRPTANKLARSGNWPGATTFATIAATKGNAVANTDHGIRRHVSDPIVGNQTIGGTLRGQLLMLESTGTANAHPQVMAKVVSNDGSTLRGVLYGGDSRTGTVDELGTTIRNYPIPAASIDPVTLASVAALNGDRIVIEEGFRANSTTSTHGASLRHGSLAAAGGANDLTVDGTETTDLNGWFEFSDDITFATTARSVRVQMEDPTGTLVTGAGTSQINIVCVKSGAGLYTPTLTVEVREGGVLLATPINAQSVPAVEGTLTGTFDNSLITTPANVELWITATDGTSAATRIEQVQWKAMGATTLTAGTSIGLQWADLALAGRSSDVRWRDLALVGRSSDLRWRDLALIGSMVELQWRDLVLAGRSSDLRWADLALVGRSSSLQWRDLELVGRSSDLRWRDLVLAGRSSDLRWRDLVLAGTSVELIWNVLGLAQAGTSASLQWSVKQLAGKSADVRWSDLVLAGRSSDLRWAERSLAGRSSSLQWRDLALVLAQADLRWADFALAGRSSGLQWRDLVLAGRSADLRWADRAVAGASPSLIWRDLALAGRSSDIRWRDLVIAGRSADLRWRDLALAGRSASLVWNTLSIALLANATIDLRWATRALAREDADLQWRDLQLAGRSASLEWAQRALAGTDADLRWSILELAGESAEALWRTLELAGRNVDVPWQVFELATTDADLRWKVLTLSYAPPPAPITIAIAPLHQVTIGLAGEDARMFLIELHGENVIVRLYEETAASG